MKRLFFALCLFVFACTTTACGGGGGGGDDGDQGGSSNWDQLVWDQDLWA